MHRTTHIRLSGLIFYLVIVLTGCNRQDQLVEQRLLQFGTIIEITMITADLKAAELILEDIEKRLALYRNQWHAWEDSDLTHFNRELAKGEPTMIPESLQPLLRLSQEYYDASYGLFNPALGKIVAAYGFHGDEPDQSKIDALKGAIPGMHNLLIDAQFARSNHPQLQIDLGGIAKGYALGLIADYLDSREIKHYIVNAGGDMQIAGNRFGQPWHVGIQNPFAPGAIASLRLQGKHSLFTSGNYQRNYMRADKLIHHIIDPLSGEPSSRQSSATILSNDPVRADVAATAMMIDGINRHSELATALQVKDYLIVSQSREIILSRSLANKLEMLSSWPVTIVD